MKHNQLPISLCHANCPKCKMPVDFKIFESGPGGDFETYVGIDSGTIYRLDLGKVYYEKKSKSDLLADAIKKEGELINPPKEIQCKICGAVFDVSNCMIDGEETIDAYEL